jgi:hypothetical protein
VLSARCSTVESEMIAEVLPATLTTSFNDAGSADSWKGLVKCECLLPIIKLFARGEGDSGGHVLRETMSRGLCGLVCPSRTSERGG